MKNFLRVVHIALQYKATLATSVVCSLLIALLWGLNFGTVYPFVQVIFKGESMQQWVDGQIVDAEENLSELNSELEQIESGSEEQTDEEAGATDKRIRSAQLQRASEVKALAIYRRIQGPIHRFLPDDPFTTLLLVVAFLMGATLLKDLFLVFNVNLVARLSELTTFDLRKEFYRNALRMDLAAFGREGTSELMARLTNDLAGIQRGIAILFGKAIREPLKMTACLIGACLISWRLLLFTLVVSPLAFFIIRRLSQSIKRANRRALEEMAGLYTMIFETFNGIQVVKAFTMERYERNRFHQTAKQYYRKSMKIAFYNSFIKPSTEILGMGVISLAILSGGYLVLNQETHLLGIRMSARPIELGAMMAFFALLTGISDPARKLSDVFSQLQACTAAADRVYEIMDREPAIAEASQPQSFPSPFSEISLDDINFSYIPNEPVLHGMNLRIRRGETLAVVGPNGCGKSTLINLIARFYDPIGGSVRIDGIDLRELRIRDLRQRIGMVTQQSFLFDDTVANNIRYGNPNATDEEVIEAAKKAHAHRFIDQVLEEGYETLVGSGGGRLSGGQRQRIALARVILSDPEILLLDEATSQVDPESERLIHEALRQFVKNRTTILITHRPSTLDLADRILVMDAGRIAGLGSHEDLLGQCPLYARLFANKAG